MKSSVCIYQPQFPRLSGRIVDGFNSLRLHQQAMTFRNGDVVKGKGGDILFMVCEDRDQQFVALMPGLGERGFNDWHDGVQSLLRTSAESISQGQVTTAVQIVGLQIQALGERALCSFRLAAQHLSDTQSAIGSGQLADVCGLGKSDRGGLQFAQVQLRSAKPQECIGILRFEFQRLLKRPFRSTCVVVGKSGRPEHKPGVDVGSGLLSGALVQRSGSGVITTVFQIARKLHGAVVAVVSGWVVGARIEQQAASEQNRGVNGFSHRHNSLNEGGEGPSVFKPKGHIGNDTVISRRYINILYISVMFKRLRIRLAVTLLVVGLLGAASVMAAEEPSWFAETYAYVLVEQDIRFALEEFGQHLNVPVVLSDKVRGKSRSSVRMKTAGEFLQTLCSTNGLTWYFDGSLLYLSASDENASRLFKAEELDLEQLQLYLSNLDVFGQQLSMRKGPGGDEVVVSGPPQYLAMVQQHVDIVQRPVATATVVRDRGVRVFRGAQVNTESPVQ